MLLSAQKTAADASCIGSLVSRACVSCSPLELRLHTLHATVLPAVSPVVQAGKETCDRPRGRPDIPLHPGKGNTCMRKAGIRCWRAALR